MAQTIVVIDDNVEITRLLRGILRQEGYRVITSNDPELCQELVEREKPDLVILDICMPRVDGWEVCQRIRQTHDVPILVLTVLTESHYVQRTLEAGASAHLAKPFTITALLEQVRSLLPKRIRPLGARLS